MASIVCSSITQIGLPYAFLMYAVSYSGFFTVKTRQILQYSTFVPLLLTVSLSSFYPEVTFNYLLLTLWVAPYILAASFLLIYAYWLESNPRVKKNRLFSAIVAVIPMLFSLYTVYVARIFGNIEVWRWNELMIVVLFAAFVAFGIRYGILGVKINIDMRQLDSNMKVSHSGTVVMNHTLKNEMGKIHLFADRLNLYAAAHHQESIREDIQVILRSTEHVLEMANRIQDQLKKITLVEKPQPLMDMMKEAVSLVGSKGSITFFIP